MVLKSINAYCNIHSVLNSMSHVKCTKAKCFKQLMCTDVCCFKTFLVFLPRCINNIPFVFSVINPSNEMYKFMWSL